MVHARTRRHSVVQVRQKLLLMLPMAPVASRSVRGSSFDHVRQLWIDGSTGMVIVAVQVASFLVLLSFADFIRFHLVMNRRYASCRRAQDRVE
eukprot:scaffold1397_cov254-Pinguiococcus_pyrenoidosus.AAC.33